MKLTLFRRLLATVCAVAAVSTGLTLLVQERTLSSDLRRAAVSRLDTSAAAAQGLVAAHLRTIAERYRTIAATPQFQATLELNDVPTLSHYAGTLAVREGAAQILFLDANDAVIASGGKAVPDDVLVGVRTSSLLAHEQKPYAVVSLALDSPLQTVGRMIAVEPVREDIVAEWSKLCGAAVSFVPAGGDAGTDPERRVLSLGSLEMHVASSLDSERA